VQTTGMHAAIIKTEESGETNFF